MGTLKRVAPHNAAEAAAGVNSLHVVQQGFFAVERSAREDHDPPPSKRALNHVRHALGERGDRHFLRLIHLAGRVLGDVGRRQLDLDDVGPQLRGDVGRIGTDVDRGFVFLLQNGTARIGPDHHGQAATLGLMSEVAQLAVHFETLFGARIDREANGRASQSHGVVDVTGQSLRRVPLVERHIVAVEFENQRNLAGELASTGFHESQGCGIGVATGVDRQPKMVPRIVSRRIHREAAGRTVFETLIDRQDDQLAGASQVAVVEHPGQIGQCARIVAAIPTQYLLYALTHRQTSSYYVRGAPGEERRTNLSTALANPSSSLDVVTQRAARCTSGLALPIAMLRPL